MERAPLDSPAPALRRTSLVVAVITAVFVLRLAGLAALTPFSEGLDFFWHLGYVVYLAEQGHPPPLGEPSLPDWLVRANVTPPGPDDTQGDAYRAWAALTPAEQASQRATLNADTTTARYLDVNPQAQHPPLYYWLMSALYRALPGLGLEARVYALTLASIALAALALPAIYKTFRLHLGPVPALLLLLALAWFPNLAPFVGRITNDTLAWPLIAWGLYFTLLARRTERAAHLAAGGALLLLACLVKAYALALLPLYLLCALVGERRLTRGPFGLTLLLAAAGAALVLALNAAATGYVLPLTEVRATASQGWAAQALAVFTVDPAWFVGGLVRGFWWLGYWSFVSPGVVYYLPLAALLYLLRPPRQGGRDWLALRVLWPHYAALALFTLALLWHAGLFTLRARLLGQAAHPGNEGWYLLVLVGQVFLIGAVLLQRRLSARAFQPVLVGLAAFMLLWSGLATTVMGVFWGGAWHWPRTLLAMRWDLWAVALLDAQTWASWLSLPGIIQPVLLTAGLPLALAVAASAWVVCAPRAYLIRYASSSLLKIHPTTAPGEMASPR